MTGIAQHRFVSTVKDRAALGTEEEARRITEAVLELLSRRLEPPTVKALADRLPPGLARAVRAGLNRPALYTEISDLYTHLALWLGLSPGAAAESAGVVLAALAESLDAEMMTHLERDLAPQWMALIRPPQSHHPIPKPMHAAPAAPHTLASGRPGSTRPLSTSQPKS